MARVMSRGRRRVGVGDMDRRITLQRRRITEPVFGESGYGEDFEPTINVWAAVYTTTGKVLFDGVGQDIAITHEVLIRFVPDITSETWIELEDGGRLDVAKPENYDERGEFLRLLCTHRGSRERGASAA